MKDLYVSQASHTKEQPCSNFLSKHTDSFFSLHDSATNGCRGISLGGWVRQPSIDFEMPYVRALPSGSTVYSVQQKIYSYTQSALLFLMELEVSPIEIRKKKDDK